MSILILAEHDNKHLKPATLNTVTAAGQISEQMGEDIHILVAGANCSAVADQAAAISGVSKVLLADNPAYEHFLAENIAALIAEVGSGYSHILGATTADGKNIIPRVAALLDVSQVSDIISVESADTFKRPIYAGNAIATVQSDESIKVITVRSTAFDAAAEDGGSASIEPISNVTDAGISRFVSEELEQSDRPELTSARVVVSGGRALGSGENFAIIEKLADKLGAAIGATRAAVDAGYAPNDIQVGQTGKVVAPELYIAIGISGAIQHLAGMTDSKVIVAINKDPDAAIFKVADYGLVADLFEVVPQMEALL